MKMDRFWILEERYNKGFREVVTLRANKPIDEQLGRHFLPVSPIPSSDDNYPIKEIIAKNASLRVDFGWSFESMQQFQSMMAECVSYVAPKYNPSAGNIISDAQCSWIGFSPFNVFERSVYEDLSTYGLIIFNNELVSFQTDIVTYISQHKSYRAHSLLRDDYYRFDYYSAMRHNPAALEDGFHFFMESVKDTIGLPWVSVKYLEESIGCHYLHYPEVFFELQSFYTLKGAIYGK